MKAESIVLAVAGTFFGLVIGWMLGSQQASLSRPAAPAASAMEAPAQQAAPAPRPLDEARVRTLQATAEREPKNAAVRTELANAYFDAERFDQAITWYQEALKLEPRNVNISTDLGIAYHYTNQPDRALEQFDYSLKIDPQHTKTMLNQGVVRAYGKQDLPGAVAAWEKLVQMAPNSEEGRAAQRALDSLKSAHPNIGGDAKPPSGTGG